MSSLPFACPYCLVSVEKDADRRLCPTCGRAYSQTMDILKFCGPGVTATPAETDLVKHLCGIYDTATFAELALARVATRPTTDERRQHFAQYNLTVRERGQRFHRMFRRKLARHWPFPEAGLALDVGCGIGTGAVPMAFEFEHVVGLDISLSALIVAKKLVESEGLTNVTLVQASARHLPFLGGVFDYVSAINVLEHIFAPEEMLAEVHRVLAVGGAFCGDSRNRYDPFFPEPHVGLRWVGFLPRRWMARYVRWRMGVNYDHTHLLSYGDLQRALRMTFGPEWQIVPPDLFTYGKSTRAKRLAEQASEVGLLRPVLTRLSPTHLVLARRVS